MLCCEPTTWKVKYDAAILHSCEQTVNETFDVLHSVVMVVCQCFPPGTRVFAVLFAVVVTILALGCHL